jgi:hypothetical protein
MRYCDIHLGHHIWSPKSILSTGIITRPYSWQYIRIFIHIYTGHHRWGRVWHISWHNIMRCSYIYMDISGWDIYTYLSHMRWFIYLYWPRRWHIMTCILTSHIHIHKLDIIDDMLHYLRHRYEIIAYLYWHRRWHIMTCIVRLHMRYSYIYIDIIDDILWRHILT